MTKFRLKLGDCLEIMKDIPENSFHSICTDPPAGIGFMGKDWDKNKGGRNQWIAWMTEVAQECLRVLKPGGHALVWALPKTSHWTATAWEDAGFELRDCIYFLFGSGFPKSMDISKQLDKMAGTEREVIGESPYNSRRPNQGETGNSTYTQGGYKAYISEPATPEAAEWSGWGTALKPAVECWWLLRKPISEKTVAQNVLKWGVGGLNIDACRIGETGARNNGRQRGTNGIYGEIGATVKVDYGKGRFPSHLILECTCEEPIVVETDNQPYLYSDREYDNKDTSMFNGDKPQAPSNYNDSRSGVIHTNPDCPGYMFPDAKGQQGNLIGHNHDIESPNGIYGKMPPRYDAIKREEKNKSASRFFYTSKASKKDRGEGNSHLTVKPTDLMCYLCRLITPPNGIVFDPFMGSGSTGKAALLEGFRFYGIEKELEYLEIAQHRIENISNQLG